jgi:hypothetical protein
MEEAQRPTARELAAPPGRRRSSFVLPEHKMAASEAHDEFCAERGAYSITGRPHGVAFVWGNSYSDFQGRTQLLAAVDSAVMVAETLQHAGYEVRPRMNMRKRFIMDELSDENLRDLACPPRFLHPPYHPPAPRACRRQSTSPRPPRDRPLPSSLPHPAP